MTKKIDASPHHEEQRELGHSFSVLSTFSYNIPSDVAEADNGHNDANCQRHEASKDIPGSQESVSDWNNKVCLIVIRKTGHTMDELRFKCIWKHNVETEEHGHNHKVRTVTAAIHLLMVFLLKITMAMVERENAARLQSRVTAPVANNHKYTLHKYSGLGLLELTSTRTAEVIKMNIAVNATISPAKRRLMR